MGMVLVVSEAKQSENLEFSQVMKVAVPIIRRSIKNGRRRQGKGIPPRVIFRRFRRKVRQREKHHRRNHGNRRWPILKRRSVELVRLYAPQIIDLQSAVSRRDTLHLCERIRRVYLQDRKGVLIDFSRTRKIHSHGMLVLVAELDRAQRMSGGKLALRCKLPAGTDNDQKIVCEVLDQIGLLERCGHPKIHGEGCVFHESVRHWRYATGTRVDDKPGDVLEKHEGRIAPALMTQMQIGLTEALINSLHHAYRGLRSDGCGLYNERRWWMFTHEVDGVLQVLVCDLGIGIPRSLPLKWDHSLLKKLSQIFSKSHPHVAAIKSALILGKSSTGEENRGKGLPQIWSATSSTKGGAVGILSGKAYVYIDSEDGNVNGGPYESEFLGTLVTWRVPVDAVGVKTDD